MRIECEAPINTQKALLVRKWKWTCNILLTALFCMQVDNVEMLHKQAVWQNGSNDGPVFEYTMTMTMTMTNSLFSDMYIDIT